MEKRQRSSKRFSKNSAEFSIARLDLRVEPLELGVPVQEHQFGVTARPVCVLEAGIPRFGERFQRLCFLVQRAEAAGDVVENSGLGGAKGQGEVRFADGVIYSTHGGVVYSEQSARAGIFGNPLQVVFQHLNLARTQIAERLLILESTEGVADRHVDIVVAAAGLQGVFGNVGQLLVPPGGKQGTTHQVVGTLAIALALNGLLNTSDCVVVLLAGIENPRLRDQHFGLVRLQGNGPLRRGHGTANPRGLAQIVVVVLRADVGDGGEAQRELGVLRDGVLKHLKRELQVLARQTARIAFAAKVKVVRLEVFGRLGGDRCLLLWGERNPQSLGDLARDLVLNLEDVLHLAVVTLRPQREIGPGVNQLRVDPQATPCAAKAAPENKGGIELLADLRRRHLLITVSENGGARKNVQALDLGKLSDDVLGDAIAKVFVLFHAAEVFEVKHRNGLFFLLPACPGARVAAFGHL